VDEEIDRHVASWGHPDGSVSEGGLEKLLDQKQLEELALFDRGQLAFVVDVSGRSTPAF